MLKDVVAGSLLLVALSAALAPAAFAQPTVTDDAWREDLSEVEALLEQEEDFQKAGKKLEKLLHRMIERYGGYRARSESFARALVYQAILDLEAGEDDLARWRWDVARNLSREVRDLDLTVFGESGRRLGEHPFRALGELPETFRPPVEAGPEAGYLPAALQSIQTLGFDILCDSDAYDHEDLPPRHRFELVVDDRGRPHAPRLITRPTHPVYVFLALEQIRQWRWKPAEKGGEPVASIQRERIDFPCSKTW